MKQLVLSFATLALLLTAALPASAARLQFGARGGINTTSFRFNAVTIDGTRFTPGPARIGYEAGFVVRLNLSHHFHLQSEINYDFVNYRINAVREESAREVRLHSERLELPVQLGFQFGPVRLFGGAAFRLNSVDRSSRPKLLQIDHNGERVAWMGGIGLNVRHFFLDLRVQGYPGTKRYNNFISNGIQRRVRMNHDLIWGGSLGFFF